VQTERLMAAAQRKIERNDRMLQARMEKLVRTRHLDQMILDRRAGLAVDPKKHLRTSAEISAEATALINESIGQRDRPLRLLSPSGEQARRSTHPPGARVRRR
jgi:hypothetical protein